MGIGQIWWDSARPKCTILKKYGDDDTFSDDMNVISRGSSRPVQGAQPPKAPKMEGFHIFNVAIFFSYTP